MTDDRETLAAYWENYAKACRATGPEPEIARKADATAQALRAAAQPDWCCPNCGWRRGVPPEVTVQAGAEREALEAALRYALQLYDTAQDVVSDVGTLSLTDPHDGTGPLDRLAALLRPAATEGEKNA